MLFPRSPSLRHPRVRQCCRRAAYSSVGGGGEPKRIFQPVSVLPDASFETFRQHAFEPATPALLPKATFRDQLPAIEKWFVVKKSAADGDGEEYVWLNEGYLAQYAETAVPLELSSTANGEEEGHGFERMQGTLGMFLKASSTFRDCKTNNVYLAQAPIPDLPPALQNDLLTPSLVLKAGKGDIYASSIWLGRAPTYTPLHRDPNPNLFVQLAGKKIIRLFEPGDGKGIFARVQEEVGGTASATIRGEEMMKGLEREVLEREVWGDEGKKGGPGGLEAVVESGDGLFVPKGWWHSVKGVGEGMTGSVNWWFR